MIDGDGDDGDDHLQHRRALHRHGGGGGVSAHHPPLCLCLDDYFSDAFFDLSLHFRLRRRHRDVAFFGDVDLCLCLCLCHGRGRGHCPDLGLGHDHDHDHDGALGYDSSCDQGHDFALLVVRQHSRVRTSHHRCQTRILPTSFETVARAPTALCSQVQVLFLDELPCVGRQSASFG